MAHLHQFLFHWWGDQWNPKHAYGYGSWLLLSSTSCSCHSSSNNNTNTNTRTAGESKTKRIQKSSMRTRSSNSTHFSFHSHRWNHACDDWPWSPHATWSSSSPSPITHHPLSQHCLLAWCIMSRVSCSLEHHDSSRSSTSTGGDMIMHMIEPHAPSASSTFLLHQILLTQSESEIIHMDNDGEPLLSPKYHFQRVVTCKSS